MHQVHKDFLDRILSHIEPISSEEVNIYDSLRRVLTADVKAVHPFPAKDTSSTNGFAIIGENTNYAPINIKVIGESACESPFFGSIENGQAVRTYMGAPIPQNADTVIADDECELKDDYIVINKKFMHGQNILYSGIDYDVDEVILKKGTKISSINLAIAASMNVNSFKVSKIPKIGVLEIGDVLVKPGEGVDPEQTISTTDIILNSFIKSGGAKAIEFGMVSEDEKTIKKKIESIKDIDLLVIAGGVSKSSSNALENVLKKNKLIEKIHLNLNEEITIMFSVINGMPIICMPSHPISSYISSVLFLKPLIKYIKNMSIILPQKNIAALDRGLDVNDLKMDYICSQLMLDKDKTIRIMPASSYDKMLMSNILRSDYILKVDKNKSKKDDIVEIIPLSD
jgi:molybdopterin molybdotransferase